MYINKNNILAKVNGIEMAMNLENGAVVGLNKSGAEFYSNLMTSNFEPEHTTDSELTELYQFLIENNFVSKDASIISLFAI